MRVTAQCGANNFKTGKRAADKLIGWLKICSEDLSCRSHDKLCLLVGGELPKMGNSRDAAATTHFSTGFAFNKHIFF